MKRIFYLTFILLFIVFSNIWSQSNEYVTPEQRKFSVEVLREVLLKEHGVEKIKAAEYLLALDYPQGVKETFENELKEFKDEKGYVVGIWMILAKASYRGERDIWIEKIRSVFDGAESIYFIYAAEALSNLGYQFTEKEQKQFQEVLKKDEVQVYTRDEIAEKCFILANEGTEEDLPFLLTKLDNPDTGVRIEAANAILRIERRVIHKMGWLSWLIIGIYGVSMVSIGYYYMRRTKSTEDYLLGGRTMKSFIVGISLYASLLSTISYLMTPGEVIRHGPIYLGIIFAAPVAFYVVGYFMIPYIMRLKVTSGYELLEKRFDSTIRNLGGLMFLSLRILWMAVIIYATTDLVIIPMLRLDQSMAPWIASILGVVTLLYTAMGGIRAVVLTDAIQFFILFGGAILALIMITVKLGGIGQWWPSHYFEHWEPIRWGFRMSGQDRTLAWFVLSMFVWYTATNGSDQMALQRFLSTRNVKAARQALGTSLFSSIVIRVLGTSLGLALLAYFRSYPHMLQDGQTIYHNADGLFPQYIQSAMPAWAGALVIAGLIAAAMSSLSSGVNSSSAVITEDFINKYRKKKMTDIMHLRTAKLVSVVVGIVVVLISLYVYAVPGNLLEVSFRLVNLLTVPLFIMFFMAMFIPWATVFGTWAGTISSTLIAVVIAFWEVIFGIQGPSFLYIMPAALVVGTVVGTIVSLLPIGSEGFKGEIKKWRSIKQG